VESPASDPDIISYSTSKHLVRYSCGRCTSPLFSESTMAAFPFRDVSVGILERGTPALLPPPPALHIFYVDRIMDVHDALPKFVGFPDTSELYKEDTEKSAGESATTPEKRKRTVVVE
jgi:hypothetical protein